MNKLYQPGIVEPKWQQRWVETGLTRASQKHDQKFYVLEMFPYTSGRLHMGHVRNFTMGDILARYKRMSGYSVLYPMGWDAFGLPAENAAILRDVHPKEYTDKAIDNMKSQMIRVGLSYDWNHELSTCSDEYVKWEQVLFIRFYQAGLVYRSGSYVNWCPSCETVLANEQAEGGVCWRCDSAVSRKYVDQWFFDIRRYADELLAGLDELDRWSDSIKNIQRNWIGRSEGVEIDFPLTDGSGTVTVFTTRADTVYGATFVLLAPEHPLSLTLPQDPAHVDVVRKFVDNALSADRIARVAGALEKEGVFTGRYAINPLTNERIPIWIANFVLMEYGTGAIMCVPAHDQRDYDFALKYELPIRTVIVPDVGDSEPDRAFEADGLTTNSSQFSGLSSKDARQAILSYLKEHGIGKKVINYRLQDWSISRQRYWGCPIPIVYCPSCGPVTVPIEQLPVLLPNQAPFTGKGGSPLARVPEFVNTTCPKCGEPAMRDTDTMDTFVDSSWYFLRFVNPHYNDGVIDPRAVEYWLPVDIYIGGIEHAVLHLMYSRFFTRALRDLGFTDLNEPFVELRNHGMVNDEHGARMSKSKGNVVEPDDVVSKYGADALRLYLMFVTAYNAPINWSEEQVIHSRKFLDRLWALVQNHVALLLRSDDRANMDNMTQEEGKLWRKTHLAIKRVTASIEDFRFNTAVAAVMELTNAIEEYNDDSGWVLREAVLTALQLLSPICPHICDELWEAAGQSPSLLATEWPKVAKEALIQDQIEIPVQVNGKIRGRVSIPADAAEEEIFRIVLSDPNVQRYTSDKSIVRRVVVPGKLVNLVVK